MTVQPDSSAGTSLSIATDSGAFHGTTAATTPIGTRVTSALPVFERRTVRHGYCSTSSRLVSINAMAAPDWDATVCVIGQPISSVINAAIDSRFSVIALPNLRTTSIRSDRLMRGHGPWSKASRAARTARSTSAPEPAGIRASACSVNGDTTPMVSSVRVQPTPHR